MVFSINQQCVFDLMEVGQLTKWNKNTRYLLSVNDVLSKFAWVVPLRNKAPEEVTKVFAKALKHSGQIIGQNGWTFTHDNELPWWAIQA